MSEGSSELETLRMIVDMQADLLYQSKDRTPGNYFLASMADCEQPENRH